MPVTGDFVSLGGGRTAGALNVPFGAYMPPEYSQELFQNLEASRQQMEKEQTRQFLEQTGAVGRLQTGGALRQGIQQVLGPSIQRRQELLGQIGLQGVQAGKEERLGTLGFERQQQMAGEQRTWQSQENQKAYMNQLSMMQKENEYKRQLLELQDELSGGGFGEFIGGLAGTFTGAMAGGMGAGLAKKFF